MKINVARIKKALAAGVGALVAELGTVLAAGGDLNQASVGAGIALAIATGWGVYAAKNRPSVLELRAQLREALNRDGGGE